VFASKYVYDECAGVEPHVGKDEHGFCHARFASKKNIQRNYKIIVGARPFSKSISRKDYKKD